VVDRQFAEPMLAALYDELCPWAQRPELDFYLNLVMSASSVLDVGCGTGELLRLARQAGHSGRLCGLDPAAAMLDVARARVDVEWIHDDLRSRRWDQEFELVVMTGHAFQVLVDDEELRTALSAIGSALTDDGRFVFETRNPPARAW
jgi:SAM-dependent methyltransferase